MVHHDHPFEEGNTQAAKHSAGGAPSGNQNAASHGLSSDVDQFYEKTEGWERQYIEELRDAILERMRREDCVDEKLAIRLATRFRIAERASLYVLEHGYEEKGWMLEEIRQYDQSIVQDMKQLGIL